MFSRSLRPFIRQNVKTMKMTMTMNLNNSSIVTYNGTFHTNNMNTNQMQMKHFSTTSDNSDNKRDKDDNSGVMSMIQKYKNNIMIGAGVTGGAITIYGITSILYNVTTSMMTLTPITSLYYGFIGGVIAAGIGSSSVVASRKLRYIHPETAWQNALYYVNTSEMVKSKMGEFRKTSNSEVVKAYR